MKSSEEGNCLFSNEYLCLNLTRVVRYLPHYTVTFFNDFFTKSDIMFDAFKLGGDWFVISRKMDEQIERTLEEKIAIMKGPKFSLTVTKIENQNPDILDKAAEFDETDKVFDRTYLHWPNKMSTSAPGPLTTGYDFLNHKPFSGVNFATQDYMSLCYHPGSVAACVEAVKRYGTHSGGSPLFFGRHPYYLSLIESMKKAFSKLYEDPKPVIYSAGWMAGFGTVSSIVGKKDFIIMDELSHNCLVNGAKASMATIYRTKHLNEEAMIDKLKEVRAANPKAGIILITEGLFSMDSDCADLHKLQQAAKQHQAVLIVDSAHDMFGFGKIGLGNAGDKIKDFSNVVLLGSGSKSLANNFGWAVSGRTNYPNFIQYYSGPFTFSNALAPAVAATVKHNIDLLMSEDGDRRRQQSLLNTEYIRKKLIDAGFEVIGEPSPIVIILIGTELLSRGIANMMYYEGFILNSVEFPACEPGDSRIRLQIQCDHTKEQMDNFVETLVRILPEVEVYIANDKLVQTLPEIAKLKAEQSAQRL